MITPLSELLRSYFGGSAAGLHLAIYGAVLVVVMLYFPGGIAGALERLDGRREGRAMTALLEVRNLSRAFGALRAVDDVSFSVREGELLGLIGPNGAGKSTLYNLIAGALEPTSGEIVFNGPRRSPAGSPIMRRARASPAPSRSRNPTATSR